MRVVGTAATAALLFSFALVSGGCAGEHDALLSSDPVAPPPTQAPFATPTSAQANRAPIQNVAYMTSTSSAPARSDSRDVRVMTFNLRVPFILDGPNYWSFRKGLMVSTIRKFDPDVLGTQECVESQAEYLRAQLSDYEFFGVGRNDGKTRGEMCALFFKKAKFDKLDGGHFWLSETPEKPGSKSWGSGWPRMVTWAKLRRRSDGQTICVFNTHFDVWGKRARIESARLLRERMSQIAGNFPTVVTGDFNDEPGSPCYVAMLGGRAGSADRPLTDALRATHPAADQREEGTMHSFWGGHGGERIDWIFASSSVQVVSAQIDHNRNGSRYPSDHFPMEAVVRVNGPTRTVPTPGPAAHPPLAKIE
jgi:endonuclease/exonuclease/phosphatase family metal-dependent hydrolase